MVIKCHHWKICLFFPLFLQIKCLPGPSSPFSTSFRTQKFLFLRFSLMKTGATQYHSFLATLQVALQRNFQSVGGRAVTEWSLVFLKWNLFPFCIKLENVSVKISLRKKNFTENLNIFVQLAKVFIEKMWYLIFLGNFEPIHIIL